MNTQTNTISKVGYYARLFIYAAIAFLTPVGAVLASGKPLGAAEYVAAAVATLIAVRAFIDKSPAQVEPNAGDVGAGQPTEVVPLVPPTP